MRRTATVIVSVALALAGSAGVYSSLHSFNYFSDQQVSAIGDCTPVSGIAAPTDIAVMPGARKAFVSSLGDGSSSRGAIYLLSIADPLDDSGWRDRSGDGPPTFHPTGLSYFEAGDKRRLFVANARARSVELFDVDANGDLVYAETITDPRFSRLSAVAAVGHRSFYVTNEADADRKSLLGRLAFFARTASGKVYYFDGVAVSLGAEGLRYAGGIAVSQNGRRAYVSEAAGPSIAVFDRHELSGALVLSRTEKLTASPQRLTVAPDGSVLVAAQPKPLARALFGFVGVERSPSLVMKFIDGLPLTEIFSDPGERMAGSTVAAIDGADLLIAAPTERRFLICRLAS